MQAFLVVMDESCDGLMMVDAQFDFVRVEI